MPVTRKQILAAAKTMTPAQRYNLIEDIRQILDDDEISPEQMAEIRRRIEDRRSTMSSVSVKEAVASLRDKLRQRRRRRAS